MLLSPTAHHGAIPSRMAASRQKVSENTVQANLSLSSPIHFGGKKDKSMRQYTVQASPADVLSKLKTEMDLMTLDYKSTQGGRTLRGQYKNNKGFVGEIEGNTFRVMTKRWYNNASAPVLIGTIEKTPAGDSIITTRIDRLPSGKRFLQAYYGINGVASLVTLPILLVQSLAGVPPVAAIVGLTAPLWSMGILYCTETPLTRKETNSLNNLMQRLYNPTPKQ